MFSKILVAFDGSKPSLDAVEIAIEIGNKYDSSLIILHVLDGYKYPYLLSSVVLAPTFGSDKLEKERQKFEELMNSLREKYSAGKKNKILASENDKVVSEGTNTTTSTSTADYPSVIDSTGSDFETAIIESETSAASTIVDYAESKNVDLLVIGSKGRTGLKKMLVGSTASEVVKYSHCPVIVVR
ncbi:MAG: universal stress protein [Candidatus Nitrosocosmicus sp.]|nr:universal stress protein [Candidatus Nitrosocosmicus sp.]MDN5866001.1 universal stress protein [Candidatus Nitrosocosmicus sp.]